MSITLQDTVYKGDGSGSVVVGGTVTLTPLTLPLFEQISGAFHPVSPPWPATVTNGSGQYTLVAPQSQESDPATALWLLTLPGGIAWAGVMPNVAGPISLYTLKSLYGWGLVSGPAPGAINAVTGPAGASAPGASAATTTALGGVLLDANPTAGSPVAITKQTVPNGAVGFNAQGGVTLPGAAAVSSGPTLDVQTPLANAVPPAGVAGSAVSGTGSGTYLTAGLMRLSAAGAYLAGRSIDASGNVYLGAKGNTLLNWFNQAYGAGAGSGAVLFGDGNGTQKASVDIAGLGTFAALAGTAAPTSGKPVARLGAGTFGGGAAPDFQGTAILGVNAPSGYTNSLLDLQLQGVSKGLIDYQGNATLTGTITGAAVVGNTAPASGKPTARLGSGTFGGGVAPDFQGTAVLGVNAAAGYTSNLADLQLAGVSKASIDYQGNAVYAGTLSGAAIVAASAPASGKPALRAGTGTFGGGATPDFQGTAQLGVNAPSGYANILADLQLAGVSKFNVDAGGNETAAGSITYGGYLYNTATAVTASNISNIATGLGTATIVSGSTAERGAVSFTPASNVSLTAGQRLFSFTFPAAYTSVPFPRFYWRGPNAVNVGVQPANVGTGVCDCNVSGAITLTGNGALTYTVGWDNRA